MGFLSQLLPGSGGNESTSSSTTTTTKNTDKRQVVDGGSIGVTADGKSRVKVTSSTKITTTDHQAVKRAIDLASTSTKTSFAAMTAALGFAENAMDVARDSADDVAARIGGAWQGAHDSASGNRTLVLAGLITVAVIAAYMMTKGR